MRPEPVIARDKMVQAACVTLLLLMGAFAVFGPTGILAWGEQQRVLEARGDRLADLRKERDQLTNRVGLLAHDKVDKDLAGELLRRNLNVAGPDEMVMLVP